VSADRVQPSRYAPPATSMFGLIEELFPICRSITGDGVRETLRVIGKHLPLKVVEVPTGAQVYDWTVPREWNIRDAAIVAPDGTRVVDFQAHTLHVMSYSVPVSARMTLPELRPHLYTLPEQPDLIPYRTSYYAERWGFCLSQNQLDALPDGEYEVFIDSTLEHGSLTYGECVLPGREQHEVLLTCHVCHPSLANDNLSGIAMLTWLGQWLAQRDRRFTYRLLFIPGTIGSLTWLSRNEDVLDRIVHGLTIAGVGDPGPLTYKRSRRGDALIDRTVLAVLRDGGEPFSVQDFSPYGYDERQFGSPGFNLPVGCVMRTPHNTYPEYHTSADNLSFVSPGALAGTFAFLESVVDALEADRRYLNLSPKGEPQLGKRGLYPSIGGRTAQAEQMAMLWVLSGSDGSASLLDIAERSGMSIAALHAAAVRLSKTDLLRGLEES
jgi:aminopeptidase-like protein